MPPARERSGTTMWPLCRGPRPASRPNDRSRSRLVMARRGERPGAHASHAEPCRERWSASLSGANRLGRPGIWGLPLFRGGFSASLGPTRLAHGGQTEHRDSQQDLQGFHCSPSLSDLHERGRARWKLRQNGSNCRSTWWIALRAARHNEPAFLVPESCATRPFRQYLPVFYTHRPAAGEFPTAFDD